MDAGRYVLQRPGWDTSSGLERYGAVHDTEYRLGGAYRGRNFGGEAFPRESSYPSETFHRDILIERDRFQPGPPPLGLWPAPRRRTLEEELAILRGAQRHDKAYVDSLRKVGSYGDFDTGRENEGFRDIRNYRDIESYQGVASFRDADRFRDYSYEKNNRALPLDQERYEADDYISRYRTLQRSSEGSPDEDYDYLRHENYESDYEHGRRDRDGRGHRERGHKRRDKSRDRDRSPPIDKRRERSRSRSHDGHGWRSQSRSRSRGKREGSEEETWHEAEYEKSDKKRDRDEKRHQERVPVAPSATVVIKGLSQKTVEDDLCQALTEWGPLRHVRVIKERNSGVSRGFAFIDFPSVEAAQKMMDALGKEGLIIDGRRLLLEYSSKPTGGLGGPQVSSARGSTHGTSRSSSVPPATVDWMCTVCGCVNFARRTSCFQCNEGRAEDAPVADASTSTPISTGKKNSEAAPTHVLVVRGLDEHVDEETLHFEFSKHAPIKDLRLVRDKFTHVSRGFAFVHFHSVEDATKALQASNGTTLDKNGQVLRVAYAKSIHGPGSSSSNPAASQNNSVAAAAIEAATFAQQYDMVGWAPKEYNPEQENEAIQQGVNDEAATIGDGRNENNQSNSLEGSAAPQSGFVWDEASGYYYDATSGFYYDGHSGLYYDGNHGVWYMYDEQMQQYVPYVEPAGGAAAAAAAAGTSTTTKGSRGGVVEKSFEKSAETTSNSKAVICAPPATSNETTEKKSIITKQAQPSTIVAQATAKKEKEGTKEKEKMASKGVLLASRKKMGNAVNLWKQRQHEAPTLIPLDEGSTATTKEEKSEAFPVNNNGVTKIIQSVIGTRKIEGVIHTKGSLNRVVANPLGNCYTSENVSKPVEKNSCTGLPVRGIIKGSVGIGDHAGFVQPSLAARSSLAGSSVMTTRESSPGSMINRSKEHITFVQSPSILDSGISSTPFKIDLSALGSYESTQGGRRRFTETPQHRATERRNLHDPSVQ